MRKTQIKMYMHNMVKMSNRVFVIVGGVGAAHRMVNFLKYPVTVRVNSLRSVKFQKYCFGFDWYSDECIKTTTISIKVGIVQV